MAEPIIVDGGAQKITITLPKASKQVSPGVFSIEPDSGDLFKSIIVTDEAGNEAFSQDDLSINWKITIK
jgi:hypothetical protein